MTTKRRVVLAAALMAPAIARAQDGRWAPNHPVRLVVPFAAGGPTDVVARILADALTPRLGQPVIVDNRTGAAGNVGGELVVRSPADGHTLLMGTTGALTTNPHLYPTMTFDPAVDLEPVSMVFSTDHVLIVTPELPVADLAEFIALAKREPGRLSYGSAGAGSSTHMVAELFRLTAGIELQHVPYRGSAPALNDLVAGTVQLMLDQIPSAIGQIEGKRVRPLVLTGPNRSKLMPYVPTVREAGLPDAEATSWGSIMVPKGTPAPVVQRLGSAIRDALAQPDVVQKLAAVGADAHFSTPAELSRTIAVETARWGKVVRDAKITVSG